MKAIVTMSWNRSTYQYDYVLCNTPARPVSKTAKVQVVIAEQRLTRADAAKLLGYESEVKLP